ncbi:Phosphoribosylformylglycinamidine synthase [Hypsibius exemplaris]|uniref:Phosphoribosylformylglycinamidine synthase n=1 Tax=Hypsibius exemplaris TaxID=2072580 RepID=A0A1W0WAF6_HYPEX|nr:Phosphoribosylformylglycinamidine synthase [Hypsibius exemplaris]
MGTLVEQLRGAKGQVVLRFAGKKVEELPNSALPAAAAYSSLAVAVRLRPIFYIELDPSKFRDDAERTRCLEELIWITESGSEAEEDVGNRVDVGNHVDVLAAHSALPNAVCSAADFEIGPRLNFKTAFCTNALSIVANLGHSAVRRIEKSRYYTVKFHGTVEGPVKEAYRKELMEHLMDRVLECEYRTPITTFSHDIPRQPPFVIRVIEEGRKALAAANVEMSLGFDDNDLDFYTDLFVEKCKRNPTNVECLDLAQSNSEHSRHWFFNGKFIIDGETIPESLFRMVKATQQHSNSNNVIKFSDNSSAILGYDVSAFRTEDPTESSLFILAQSTQHPIFTAETHNFPTAVEPFSGATTGTGGRIRDVQATGRGGHVIAGTAGYSFGNVLVPGFLAPWEDNSASYPDNFARPLKVLIEASNGASDYGNKFGEPLISGFSRSFGQRLANGERREWVKPIMFTGGIGSIDNDWIKKDHPEIGMKVLKVGGPVYRIGLGGGAASSTQVQGSNDSAIDFNAVQRGDAEMEQKMNRVIRGCIEMDDNPILSIHDQGAGGNANVLKEIVEPAGAVIHADNFSLGDETLSIHEVWVAEYQESNAILVAADKVPILQKLARRERCPVDVVGEITGSGKIVLEDFSTSIGAGDGNKILPEDLQLDLVLSGIPQKEYRLQRNPAPAVSSSNQETVSRFCLDSHALRQALHQVLQLPAVASKRFLTNKVDRSVTGLIAQQQCVGPLHTPLADVAVVALSMFDTWELDGARQAAGRGAALYDACEAMCGVMKELGIAVDGGKDSLSMAAKCGDEIVKAPNLVISTYAPCPDIRKKITPDLKVGWKRSLFWIDLSKGKRRLGGSAFAQANGRLSQLLDAS